MPIPGSSLTKSSAQSYSFVSKISDHAKTFGQMVALIQDEVDDTTGEYSIQIQDSIVTALRLCEQEPFFFNKMREMRFKTQSGKTWYGYEDTAFLETEMVIESLVLEKKEARRIPLLYKSGKKAQKEYKSHSVQGTPVFYTFLDQQIGLFPTPDTVETVRLFWRPAHFSDSLALQDQNPWFVYAFDLIKARAKYELYKNILKDAECAAVAFSDFQEQLQLLRYETSRREGCSHILSTRF
ncbi:phage adaptor protein [Bartonella rochalimae]|uniref:phage adaptor protein n=1 Tax=Bartonella rochalimae TaxID=395923 RepID=UPI003F686B58